MTNGYRYDTLDLRELVDEWRVLLEETPREDLDAEDGERIAAMESLAQDLGYPPNPDGLEEYAENEPLMIAARDFEEYAQELAEDIGAIPADSQWPVYCIDWERAARELAMDYSLCRFDGTDYYVRSV